MNLSLKSFAAGAAVMIVLGTGSAVAATGGHLILGHSNSATATTVLSDTKGTPLSLKAPSSKPALIVSNSKVVSKLNADLLDGKNSTSFALTAGRTGEYQNTYTPIAFDSNGDGTNDSTAIFATCPAGSVPTGGSAYNPTGAAILDGELTESSELLNGTSGPTNSYITVAAGTTLATQDNGADFGAVVFCYDPKGALPAQKLPSARLATASVTPAHVSTSLAALHNR